MLSEALGDDVDVTLIDKSDAFVFGYSKLDVMFGRTTPDAVRLPYRDIAKPGVRFLQRDDHRDRSRSAARDHRRAASTRPTSWSSRSAPTTTWTPRRGSPRGGTSSTRWAAPSGWREVLPTFSQGRAIVGVCGAPFKCPPAPSEAALLLHDYLSARGVRDACEISFVIPFGSPVPPSPDTSAGTRRRLRRAGIEFVAGRRVSSLDPAAASPCSTTAASCPTTSSSASRSTAPPTWSWRAG